MRLLQVFSKNLRKYRNESGLSQEAFANKAGLHRTYISALERGKRSVALDNIEKIADALGIDAYLLFIDIPNETSTDIKWGKIMSISALKDKFNSLTLESENH